MRNVDDTVRPRAAVIGAGLAGAACANELAGGGCDVTVYEKSRGTGGRAGTRRHRDIAVDHGAQYFTARTPAFRAVVSGWMSDGVAGTWDARVVHVRGGTEANCAAKQKRYVGVPGMSALSRHMLRGITVVSQTRVRSVRRQRDGWMLRSGPGRSLGPFDALFVAIPPSQAVEVADGTSPLVNDIRQVVMVPCWAVVVAFESQIDAPWDAAQITDSALAWVARNTSKPGRPAQPDVWTLHANAEWSREYLEDKPQRVAHRLMQAFAQLAPIGGASVLHLEAHRWRYARPKRSDEPRPLFDPINRIGFCGDWTGHARIESAVLSGIELARVAAELLAQAARERHGA